MKYERWCERLNKFLQLPQCGYSTVRAYRDITFCLGDGNEHRSNVARQIWKASSHLYVTTDRSEYERVIDWKVCVRTDVVAMQFAMKAEQTVARNVKTFKGNCQIKVSLI